mmetsp:Transcript_20554/g.56738  ORF Transcript_20554/g.56738 Transcript_20554/m.56738 type:complete len:547 (-) Transcript_20554:863-2503(-)|eukprot:CAMPEP_0168738876 /NCGR_PEP_ID=MMETSP0724-20121128/11163_1 /TAXON_ID=265536 /ORGANISM="Amphiprora sp., Strain CCMP467" /LENGTH=546 /DNA_ID=CAMNT_0008786241 /DNA_START=67 /DNA_END=1707 /DNA_ORIENTATION=+
MSNDNTNNNKRPRREGADLGDSIRNSVASKGRDMVILQLQTALDQLQDEQETYYSSSECAIDGFKSIPDRGFPANHVKERIIQNHELDNRPRLNTSSYVNVVTEPEERDVALMGLEVNLADASVYPASVELHDKVVNMIAELWNCPAPPPTKTGKTANFSGSGTVGSTEACLLAGLALKFRWRKWYAQKHGLTPEQVTGVVPNIVISTCYQAAWEKLFRYFDVIPNFVLPTLQNKMRIDAEQVREKINDKTIAVVGILGNHYNGAYDPIWDLDKVVSEVNAEKGWQVGIHVDGASGGFIAPFQENVPPFDFRLTNVLSMSASGHKFGESVCGTGWLVFRHRHDLAEHISVSVTYLGGVSDSMTLNFSRPATGPYVQAYKFLRLGKQGYRSKVQRQLDVTNRFRNQVRDLKVHGKPLFEICDCDQEPCLPVFAARLHPDLQVDYTDFSIQHAIGEFHWYVGAYYLSFEDFSRGGTLAPLCSDESVQSSMFRVVFKSNLTHSLSNDLFGRLKEVMEHLQKDQVMKSVRSVLMEVYGEVKAHSNQHKAC